MEFFTMFCEFLLLWIFLLRGELLSAAAEVLKCYDCSDSFKNRWDPFTDCQLNVSAVPIATCLESEPFCKVEKVSVKGTGATISITRACAGECYYGCRVVGYGVSKLRCTSCCNHTLCNTDSGSGRPALLPGPLALQRSMLVVVVALGGGLAVRWTWS